MEKTNKIIELSSLSLPDLDKVLKNYPWFSLARKEFFMRMTALGEEYRNEGLKKAAIYVFSREGLLRDGQKVIEKNEIITPQSNDKEIVFDLDDEDFSLKPAEEPAKKETIQKKEIHIVGGDYFGKEDIDSLKEDGMTTLQRFNSFSSEHGEEDNETVETQKNAEDNFTDECFYTETLAKIYSAQGFYQRALDVYEKLILLYPEKSTYFAALKEDTKKHL
jgi:tetratricopeptide (TPR) repeat protein